MKHRPTSELSHWLEAQGDDGEYDSAGQFSLSAKEAWKKLGAFQLSMANGWVLKFMQAVAAEPKSRIKVHQLFNESIFTVRGVKSWTREPIEDTIFGFSKTASTSLGHLALAIRALAQNEENRFSVLFSDGEHVVWTGERFKSLPRNNCRRFELRVAHSSVSNDLLNSRRASLEILSAIQSYCYLFPKTLLVDGFLLSTGTGDPDLGARSSGNPLALLKGVRECSLPKFQLARTCATPKVDIGKAILSIDNTAARGLTGSDPCRYCGILSVFADKLSGTLAKGASMLLWLKDGVIVHRERLTMPQGNISLGIVVSAEGLETDLSGLVPRATDAFEQRRKLVLGLMQQELESLVMNLGEEGVTTEGKSVVGAVGGLLGLLCTGLNPILGASIVAGSVLAHRYSTSGVEALDRRLDSALQQLSHELKLFVERLL